MADDREVLETLTLVAWVSEDKFPDGSVGFGLKQGMVPAGMIPLVAIGAHQDRLDNPNVQQQIQRIADFIGHPVYLCEFKFTRVITSLSANGAATQPVSNPRGEREHMKTETLG